MPKSRLQTAAADSSTGDPAGEAFSKLRAEMVERAIVARGVRSEPVLRAMRSVPREAFLPHQLREFAYIDSPLTDRRRTDDLTAIYRRLHDRGAGA